MRRLSLAVSITLAVTSGFAEPVTTNRVNELPPAEQTAWKTYLERSQASALADQAAVQAEVVANKMTKALRAPSGGDFKLKPKVSAAWFAGDEAKQLADAVLLFIEDLVASLDLRMVVVGPVLWIECIHQFADGIVDLRLIRLGSGVPQCG